MNLRTLSTAVIMLFFALNYMPSAHAACPESKQVQNGDIRIYHESWKTDWWIYKSIGTRISTQRLIEERRWWCLWLCTTSAWVNTKANHLRLEANFYAAYSPSPLLVATAVNDQLGIFELKYEIWSFGFGSLKLTDAGFQYRPSGAPILSVDGIQSIASGSATINNVHVDYDRGCAGAGKQP